MAAAHLLQRQDTSLGGLGLFGEFQFGLRRCLSHVEPQRESEQHAEDD